MSGGFSTARFYYTRDNRHVSSCRPSVVETSCATGKSATIQRDAAKTTMAGNIMGQSVGIEPAEGIYDDS